MNKKIKYDRRRAIDCKIVRKSKTHDGYCKYIVTVADKDGTISKHPVYGKDMQNALKRLMNQEKTKWFENKISAGWIVAAWLLIMGTPAVYFSNQNGDVQPHSLLASFGTVLVLSLLGIYWNRYINRGSM